MPSNSDIEYHFTLVHGTFATNAPWTQEQSVLCRSLAKELGAVAFSRFNWTGQNSYSARTAAGLELAAFVKAAGKTYPNASHFIPAHSHGGNVALYAHRLLANETQHTSNIITLATPFISGEVRNLSLFIRVGWIIALGVLSLMMMAAGISSFFNPLLNADSPLCASTGWEDSSCLPGNLLMLVQVVATIAVVQQLVAAYAANRPKSGWPGSPGLRIAGSIF